MVYGTKFGEVVFLFVLVAMFFFVRMLYQLLKKIPSERHALPIWFVWFFLLPIIGLVFEWIMLPFAIPKTLKNNFATNQDAIFAANTLFKLGLMQVGFATFSIFYHYPPINDIAALISVIAWVCYWIMAVKFKKTYLK